MPLMPFDVFSSKEEDGETAAMARRCHESCVISEIETARGQAGRSVPDVSGCRLQVRRSQPQLVKKRISAPAVLGQAIRMGSPILWRVSKGKPKGGRFGLGVSFLRVPSKWRFEFGFPLKATNMWYPQKRTDLKRAMRSSRNRNQPLNDITERGSIFQHVLFLVVIDTISWSLGQFSSCASSASFLL